MITGEKTDVEKMEQKPATEKPEVARQEPVEERKQSGRDAAYWAQPVDKLKITDVPTGAINLNMDGRQVTSPLQGFGRMWQRTYRIKLSGVNATPAQVVEDWKKNFAVFQAPGNHFYPSLAGIKPGEVVFIDTMLPVIPGMRGIMPVAVGVMVLYADDETFTVMTPEGHPFAGWNTFSAFQENGETYAQIQALCRPSDPIYEFGYRFLGGEPQEDKVWFYVLKSLAAHWNVQNAEVEFTKSCVDPSIQWKHWKNIWKNAMIRTSIYVASTPVRWIQKRGK